MYLFTPQSDCESSAICMDCIFPACDFLCLQRISHGAFAACFVLFCSVLRLSKQRPAEVPYLTYRVVFFYLALEALVVNYLPLHVRKAALASKPYFTWDKPVLHKQTEGICPCCAFNPI